MPRPAFLIRLFVGIVLLTGGRSVVLGQEAAVVHGASSLHVRSGPGREHPSFATLSEGSKVQVEQIEGSWARIRTSAGVTGYVHKAFLVLQGAEPAAPEPAEAEPAAKVETVVEDQVSDEEPAAREGQPVGEVAKAPPPAPPTLALATTEAVGPTPGMAELVATQRRLQELVEGLREDVNHLVEATRRTEENFSDRDPLPTPFGVGVGAVDATESGSLLGLSIIGLVAGFVMGTIYGRRQERGRRTRVRF